VRRRQFALACVVLLGLAAKAGAQTGPLSVFAAASLKDAFTEAGDILARRQHGFAARFNFAGSQQLALQITQGAEADVFAAADQRSMDVVGDKGMLAGAAVIFARNRLVVITPSANPGRVSRLQDLARPGLKLVLAAEAVPVGRYSREMLTRLGGGPGFRGDFAARVLRNVVSEEDNVKAVVAKVQLGEADAGIAYVSDVTPAMRRPVRLIKIPDAFNVIAAYPIAVLAESRKKADAQALVNFLMSEDGRRLLERHGLLAAGP
jgi:molybdate transport system substrate-binding protein